MRRNILKEHKNIIPQTIAVMRLQRLLHLIERTGKTPDFRAYRRRRKDDTHRSDCFLVHPDNLRHVVNKRVEERYPCLPHGAVELEQVHRCVEFWVSVENPFRRDRVLPQERFNTIPLFTR